MDKAQKELMKSYWHARKIAAEEDSAYGYEPHELTDYSLNNVIDPGDLKYGAKATTIAKYLEMNPEEKVEDYLYSLRAQPDEQIAVLLTQRPEYFKYYDPEKVFDKFNPYYLAELLKKQPQFIKYVDVKDRFGDDDDGNLVFPILEEQPQLASYFNLPDHVKNKYAYMYVKTLLIKQPQFAKVPELAATIKSSTDIEEILIAHPELIKYLNLNDLHDFEKVDLVSKQPKLFKHFIRLFDNPSRLGRLIQDQPKLWDTVDTSKLTGHTLSFILQDQPQLIEKAKKLPAFDELRSYHVRDIIAAQPQLIKHFANKIDKYDLVDLLDKNPKLITKMPKEMRAKADYYSLGNLLKDHPELIKHFDYSEYGTYELKDLIIKQPSE